MKAIIKNSLFVFASLFFLNDSVIGQQYSGPSDFRQEIERYYNNGVVTYNSDHPNTNNNNAYVGKNASSTETKNTFRMIYTWLIGSIPPNANITSATLGIACLVSSNAPTGQPGYVEFEIKTFPNSNFNSLPSTQWAAINSATVLKTEQVPRNMGWDVNIPLGQNFIDYIQSSLISGKLHLAFRAADEETFGTDRNIHYLDFKKPPTYNVVSAVRITINYTIPPTVVSITAQNNFPGGRIFVDDMFIDKQAPHTFTKIVGENVHLKAKEQIDNLGYNRIWNDIEAPNSLSRWYKNGIPGSFSIENQFNAELGDNNAIYETGLRKRYDVSRNNQTEFDGNISAGIVAQIVEQNSGQISAPAQQTINGRTYNFAGWTDGLSDNPRTIFPTDNVTYTARYKMVHKSNDENAYINNSQRKFIRTPNGHLHLVYESMNDVWYEKSTNNGQSWEIVFSTFPRYSNFPKCTQPNLTYYVDNQGNTHVYLIFVIVDPTGDRIPLLEFVNDSYTVIERSIENFPLESGRKYMNPVAACSKNGEIFCAWETKLNNTTFPLQYAYGKDEVDGYINWYNSGSLNFTSSGAEKLAVSVSQDVNDVVIHLAWQQEKEIFYSYLTPDQYNHLHNSEPQNVSRNAGFVKNYNPSIIEFNGGARVCWIGQRDEYPSFPEGDKGKTVVFTDPNNVGRYWTFGSNVNSVSINRSNSCYAIAWASDNNNERIHYTDCNTLRDVYSLNIIGKHVQLSNGTTPNTMQALAFNTSNLPYYMQTEQLYADPEPIYVEEKREGVVSEAEAQVYFNIGDIEVDGEKVGFVEIPDTVNITSQQTANQYLVSLPFSLTDNSEFFYSVKYGLTDSLAALSMLSGGKSISFKVELLDAQTNEVLGVFDEVTYDQGNLIPYEKIDYQVLTNGIGERLVKMRLIINSNFTPSYSVAEKYEEPSGLAKKSYKQIGYQGSLAVKEYALEQNYPNPFNPTTTISWQSPVSSHQTLKVFDVLGREVATLVNEWKEAGRYSIEFDASNLASGVYIYQLRVNDYVATKKLLMIK